MIRLHVPSEFGMVQADGLQGKVTAVNTTNNTITLDIDSSAFTAFAFPTSASVPFTQAHIVPFGDVANGVESATDNTGKIIMRLGAGADGPAGSASDKIYWRAWKAGYTKYE
jgi:hypothetical protein